MDDSAPTTSRIEQPLSKTAYVLARLREELADGSINPGQPLRQVEIAERYGVSPTPVREALRMLEADGTIRYAPHRGATVTELTPLELSDLYLVRTSVESLLTRLAAERASSEEVAEIRARHEDIIARCETDSAAQLSQLNREFHLAVLRLGSPLVAQHVVEHLWQRFLPPSKSQWRSEQRNALFVSEHEHIVQALEKGDAAEAEAAMGAHLGTAMRMREEAGDFDISETSP